MKELTRFDCSAIDYSGFDHFESDIILTARKMTDPLFLFQLWLTGFIIGVIRCH